MSWGKNGVLLLLIFALLLLLLHALDGREREGKRTEKKKRVAELARMELSLHCFERELRRISADAMLPLRRDLFIGKEKGEERGVG